MPYIFLNRMVVLGLTSNGVVLWQWGQCQRWWCCNALGCLVVEVMKSKAKRSYQLKSFRHTQLLKSTLCVCVCVFLCTYVLSKSKRKRVVIFKWFYDEFGLEIFPWKVFWYFLHKNVYEGENNLTVMCFRRDTRKQQATIYGIELCASVCEHVYGYVDG